MDDISSEAYRFECECRGWLRRGYGSPEGIKRLRRYLAPKRSKQNIAALIDGMREQARRDPSLIRERTEPWPGEDE